MADVVLRLSDEEIEAGIDAMRAGLIHRPDDPPNDADLACPACSLQAKLRAALDSPPVEERVEEIIVGCKEGEEVCFGSVGFREMGEGWVEEINRWEGCSDARLQVRTITVFSNGSTLYGPWTDLPREGEQ